MSTEETRDNIAPEAQEEMSEESLNELRKIRRDKHRRNDSFQECSEKTSRNSNSRGKRDRCTDKKNYYRNHKLSSITILHQTSKCK